MNAETERVRAERDAALAVIAKAKAALLPNDGSRSPVLDRATEAYRILTSADASALTARDAGTRRKALAEATAAVREGAVCPPCGFVHSTDEEVARRIEDTVLALAEGADQ